MTASTPAAAPQTGTVRANLIATGIAEGVARVAQLLTIALLGRMLGPAGLGVVGTAWAVYQLALPSVQYAPELIGIRDVARGNDVRDAVADLTAVKLVIAALSALVITVAAILFFGEDRLVKIQLLAQGPLLFTVALSGVWALRGQRRFAAYALVRCVSTVGLLVVLWIALSIDPVPWMVPLSEGVIGIVAIVLTYPMLVGWRCLPDVAAKIFHRLGKPHKKIGEALRFSLASSFGGIIWSAPLLVGHPFLDLAKQGNLAAAIRLLLAVIALYQLALQVFHPVLAHRYATDREAGRRLAAALVAYSFVFTVPAAIVLALISPLIVPPLLGAEFTAAAGTLTLLASAIVPVVVGSVFGYCLLADGHYRLYVLQSVGGAIAAVLGCGAAFYWFPQPEAGVVLTLVVTLLGAAGAMAAWRLDLVRFSAVSWRLLTPSGIHAVLKER